VRVLYTENVNTTENELASYKFLLRLIYDEIVGKCNACDYCDDLVQIKIKIDRIASELNLTLEVKNKAN